MCWTMLSSIHCRCNWTHVVAVSWTKSSSSVFGRPSWSASYMKSGHALQQHWYLEEAKIKYLVVNMGALDRTPVWLTLLFLPLAVLLEECCCGWTGILPSGPPTRLSYLIILCCLAPAVRDRTMTVHQVLVFGGTKCGTGPFNDQARLVQWLHMDLTTEFLLLSQFEVSECKDIWTSTHTACEHYYSHKWSWPVMKRPLACMIVQYMKDIGGDSHIWYGKGWNDTATEA